MHRYLLPALLTLGSALAAPTCATAPLASDRFPTWSPGTTYATEVAAARAAFADKPLAWWTYVAEDGYTWDGDYLGSGRQPVVAQWQGIKLDAQGIPVVKYGDTWYRNPITITQDALRYYGRVLKDGKASDRAAFLKETQAVLNLQDAGGGIRFPFSWRYFRNLTDYNTGWVSGMAQGQALSLYARAYKLTGDVNYLNAGRKALTFMLKPLAEGGTRSNLGSLHPSLSRYVWFEEYRPTGKTQPNHVLNGFLFSILGLHDWSQVDKGTASGTLAGQYFACSAYSAERALFLFDVGGYTAYDLGHLAKKGAMNLAGRPQIDQAYQGVHIYLSLALHDVTARPAFLANARRWNAQVGDLQPIQNQ